MIFWLWLVWTLSYTAMAQIVRICMSMPVSETSVVFSLVFQGTAAAVVLWLIFRNNKRKMAKGKL